MCTAAVAAIPAGCAPQPVEQNLTIEFLRDPEPGGAIEIKADVRLDRDAADQDDEAIQDRIDDIAAELADGTSIWHQRFDRLRDPASDGIDLRKQEGLISRFQRWAVMTEPGPALVDFFADTQIVPAYEVSGSSGSDTTQPDASRTVTLSFGLAREAHPTDEELADAREELLEVANAIVRLQGTVGEVESRRADRPGRIPLRRPCGLAASRERNSAGRRSPRSGRDSATRFHPARRPRPRIRRRPPPPMHLPPGGSRLPQPRLRRASRSRSPERRRTPDSGK